MVTPHHKPHTVDSFTRKERVLVSRGVTIQMLKSKDVNISDLSYKGQVVILED